MGFQGRCRRLVRLLPPPAPDYASLDEKFARAKTRDSPSSLISTDSSTTVNAKLEGEKQRDWSSTKHRSGGRQLVEAVGEGELLGRGRRIVVLEKISRVAVANGGFTGDKWKKTIGFADRMYFFFLLKMTWQPRHCHISSFC
ncbi:unnamed protein product [Linum trigynum]|uniref:Uncharacterized protein n=1 Tax=Linum trigynum TaxID=586398 RepID=A0AAV2D540_9ROSI